MPKIIGNGHDNQCVARAVSTIRNILGYRYALPRDFPLRQSGIRSSETAHLCQKWFPKHDVVFWSREDVGKGISGWMGSAFEDKDFSEDHLAMFDYSVGNGVSHMVVGLPCLYSGMTTATVIRVSIKKKRIKNGK